MRRQTFLLACVATACIAPPPLSAGSSQGAPPATSTSSASPSTVPAIPYRWKSVTVLGGGFVTGLVYSPVKSGVLYARTDIGGAYRYEPGSQSWLPLTDFLSKSQQNYFGVESIAADPQDANRVFMAVGMYTQSWAGPGGFMRSSDQGNSWQIFPTPELKMGGNEDGRANGERLAVDPRQTRVLYFGSRRNGLWKSADAAETWSKVESFPLKEDTAGLGIPFVVFDPKSGAPGKPTPVIYAGVSRRDVSLYRSADGGGSWAPLPHQPTGLMPHHAELDRNGALYVCYGLNPGPTNVPDGAVYRFEPQSGAWTDITPLKPGGADKFGYGGLSLDVSHPGTLLVAAIDRWTSGGEVFRSTDSGKTWQPLMAKAELDSGGAPHVYSHKPKIDAPQWVGDIAIDPFDSQRAMLVTGGGIWASDDLGSADKQRPTHWTFRNRNLEETAVTGIVSPPVGAPLLSSMSDLCGFRHDKLDESPSRGNFEKPNCASGSAIEFAELKPNLVVRAGSHPWDGSKGPRGAISSDGGATWTPFSAEPAGSAGSGNVVITAGGEAILWAARDARVAYSADRGAGWVAAAGLPDPAKIPDWAPLNLKLAADRVNGKKVYAFDALTGSAYTSADGGLHFEPAAHGLPTLPDYDLIAASLRAVPGFEGDVWLTVGKQLLHSTDEGQSFGAVAGVDGAYAVGFGRAAPGQKYPAVYLSGKVQGLEGVFRSDDGGASFSRINDDAHQYGGAQLVIGDPRVYGRAYITGHGRGILYGEPLAP
ncbi:MAG: hypothetical protein ABUL60_00395 [Myxococcales bacterium]